MADNQDRDPAGGAIRWAATSAKNRAESLLGIVLVALASVATALAAAVWFPSGSVTVGGVVVATPDTAFTIGARALIGGVVGLAIALGAIFGWSLLRAPYQQRERLLELARQQKADDEKRFNAVRYRFQMERLDGALVQWIDATTNVDTFGYRFILIFTNGGLDPIEFEVETMALSVGGYTNEPSDIWSSNGGLILPGRGFEFYYHRIVAPIDPPRPGRGEYVVRYGYPDSGVYFRTHHEFLIHWAIENGQSKGQMLTQGVITHEPIG